MRLEGLGRAQSNAIEASHCYRAKKKAYGGLRREVGLRNLVPVFLEVSIIEGGISLRRYLEIVIRQFFLVILCTLERRLRLAGC